MARPQTVSDQEILAAARRCFSEGGPGTPLSAVAEALGVSVPAILKRMGSKAELMARSLHMGDWEPPPFQRLADGPSPGPLLPQLNGMLDGAFSMILELFPALVTLRLGDLPLQLDGSRPSPPERFKRLLGDWLRRASESRDLPLDSPETVAGLVLSSLQAGAFMNWMHRESEPVHRPDWEQILRVLLPGWE